MGLKEPDQFRELQAVVKQYIKYRGLYLAQKEMTAHIALWLEANRRLIKEKGVFDFDRLLDILKEIEAEEDRALAATYGVEED